MEKEKLDSDLKEKIDRSQKILDVLKKLVNGEIDVTKCLDKKCCHCGKNHPSLEDVISLASNSDDEPCSQEESEKLKNNLETITKKGGSGVGLFAVRAEDGELRKFATIFRNIDVSELLTVATIFVKNAYTTALEHLGPEAKKNLQDRIVEAVKESFNE